MVGLGIDTVVDVDGEFDDVTVTVAVGPPPTVSEPVVVGSGGGAFLAFTTA